MSKELRIAVVGGGMAGLTAARVLNGEHEVTLFEADSRIGGHARTIQLPNDRGLLESVDTGVCMFFTAGYPNFFRLLNQLRVPSFPSETHAELLCTPNKRRYFFHLNAPWKTFASSVLSSHQRWLVRDGLKFRRYATRILENGGECEQSLGEHLDSHGYSEPFRLFLSLFCGGTWTLYHREVCEVPFHFVARTLTDLGFFPAVRHGVWHFIPGSVRRYLDALASPIQSSILLGCQVERVERGNHTVTVSGKKHGDYFEREFDQVIFAIPPQQALEFIANPTQDEIEVLGTFRSKDHEIAFMSDEELASSWASEGTTIFAASDVEEKFMEFNDESAFRVGFVDITRMNRLNLADPLYMWYQFPNAPQPRRVHKKICFSTPVFTKETLQAQRRHADISGRDRLHFCGTAWTNGIHEGAVTSALNVTKSFGLGLEHIE